MPKALCFTMLIVVLASCASPQQHTGAPPSVVEAATTAHRDLLSLGAPAQKVAVAVYDYPDETGQFKPGELVTNYSKAVTQGAISILIKALADAGSGRWFTVVERARLNHLLKERQIITEMRKRYGEADRMLPAMLFAGVILEGGIIGFDTNTLTGGIGARYLGIGASTEYRQDTVTVYLRAVSTQTGEILKSVTTRKTIVSYGLSASVFRFVSFKKLLEVEAGYTSNEPAQLAIQQAIEKAVYALILEGAQSGLWQFRDPLQGQRQIEAYLTEKYQDIDANLARRLAQATPALATPNPDVSTSPVATPARTPSTARSPAEHPVEDAPDGGNQPLDDDCAQPSTEVRPCT
ncbi:MAG: CsgG/HfaB family protein [Gammaproteobacteria bacterium]